MAESILVDEARLTPQEVEYSNTASVNLVVSSSLYRTEMRLDAGHYNLETMAVFRALESSGLALKRLGDITERIFIPPRFKRIYVDSDHGIPFLQGTHLPQFKPTDLKYLSRSAHKNLTPWIIQAGWVLVTCSGTIGRVAIALRQWDGWAASQHILRIVPKHDSPCPPGYIYAWLSSPFGQAQFNGVYGAVVEEITAKHVEDILIPVPETAEQRAVVDTTSDLAVRSLEMKTTALDLDAQAIRHINSLPNLGATTLER